MPDLSGRAVLVGVTGGIAAYKACEVVSRLKKLGADVRVIETEHARRFVPPLTFEALSGRPVATDMFESPAQWEIRHISWAKAAALCIVAPATANILGKYANGIADDMLSTTLLAARCPVLLAPAMNAAMWRHPATQANVRLLLSRGARTVGPDSGHLACGDDGEGRMAEPEAIVEAALSILCAKRDYEGARVLVTAGPTREPLDPVRFLTNRSSGKMGYALAEAALARGARVTLVTGPVSLTPPSGAEVVRVETTADLCAAMERLCPAQDVIIQAAAPADFTCEAAAQKIKKTDDGPLVLTLSQTPDVAARVGAMRRPGQKIAIFAAETESAEAHARAKMRRKGADLVVANDVTKPGAGFDVETNVVTLITESGAESLPLMTKRDVADRILDALKG